MAKLCAAFAASLACLPAHAINKCVGSDGRTTYSDAPCKGGERSSSVVLPKPDASQYVPTPAQPQVNTSTAAGTTERLETFVKNGQNERDIDELQRKVKAQEFKIKDDHLKLQKELLQLQVRKLYAANNLAGATYEQSISEEMQATTASWDIRIREDERELDAMRIQLATLEK